MILAVLLLVCLVLAGAVAALVVLLRRVEARLASLESRPSPLVEEGRSPVTKPVEVDGLATGAGAPSSTSGSEFVITRLGHEPDDAPVPALETRLFADVVLRETVVKAASWTYAVRRSLSPANRNRIWFEMRREVKRARKERKAEEREAIREYRARRRGDVPDPVRGESAA
jgi:hypothetical protein